MGHLKGKTDQYTVTQALNICGQSPRYKPLTLSVVTTPGKSLNIDINTLTEKGRKHLLRESGDHVGTAGTQPPPLICDSQKTADQIRDLERQLQEKLSQDVNRKSSFENGEEGEDGRESRETFIEQPQSKYVRMDTKVWKKKDRGVSIDQNRYYQNYKNQWDSDLKHLVLDYQKTLNTCGPPVSLGPNGLPRINFQSMQDPTFRGLSDLWTRFDRGNSTLESITNPADNDGSKSPAKSLDKKKKKDP